MDVTIEVITWTNISYFLGLATIELILLQHCYPLFESMEGDLKVLGLKEFGGCCWKEVLKKIGPGPQLFPIFKTILGK